MNDIMKHLTDSGVRQNLKLIMTVGNSARDILLSKGFDEINTPILIPRTGERYNSTFNIMLEEKEAMLADSPQICKMLLVRAGYEKNFRFAHCFRSITGENKPHTRLSEFTQLDLELRNTDLDELILLAKTVICEICAAACKTVKTTYLHGLDCREKFGTEMCPDLRKNDGEMSLAIIKNMPLTNDGKTPCHHIFAMPSDNIGTARDLTKITTESFDIILNGIEIGGGDMRINDRELQKEVMRIFNVDEKRYANYLDILKNSEKIRNGGFAIGLERTAMALSGAENISQTTAFPDYFKRGIN